MSSLTKHYTIVLTGVSSLHTLRNMTEGKRCRRCEALLRGRDAWEVLCGPCRREPAALIIDHDTLEVIDESVERADGHVYTQASAGPGRRELRIVRPRDVVRCSKRVPEVA